MNTQTAFLSHPVTEYLSEKGGYYPDKRRLIENSIEAIQSLGIEVECAALNEDFGRVKLTPVEFTAYDIDAISRSTVFILVATNRVSRDMYLETGLAWAKGIPVCFFVPKDAWLTYMILGMEEMSKLRVFRFESESEIPDMIRREVPFVVRGEQ